MCQVKFGLNTAFFFKFGSVFGQPLLCFLWSIAAKNSCLFNAVVKNANFFVKKISTTQAKLKPDPNAVFQKRLQR